MGDDARDGVAAAVVVAEHLAEEAPEGRDRAEHPVAVLDLVFVEDFQDAGLGQDLGERQPLAAREAGANRLQTRHGSPSLSGDGILDRGRHHARRSRRPTTLRLLFARAVTADGHRSAKIRRRGQAGHQAVARAASRLS